MKSFKFYNPFKPHVVQFAKEDVYWWSIDFTFNWCCVDTYEQAAVLRDKVHVKSPRPMKVEKVYG
jgi:hypothetical protein